jgi:hypothetical protein
MIARIITIVYFVIGLIVAVNQGYLGDGIAFSAEGLWKLADFVLAVGFWPLIVITNYDFALPDAILRKG